MQFKINPTDLSLIVDALSSSDLATKFRDAEESVANGKYPTGRYIVDLSEAETETVLDALSDCLTNSGIDDDGELNSLGYQLETLIDLFNTDKKFG